VLTPYGGSAIEFESLTFHYPSRPAQAALRNFSLKVPAGQTIALVGPSGAGKSTVFQLLLRYFDAQSGRILLDGVPTQQLSLQDLRKHIGIVPQDAVIFSSSAWDNIRYGRPNATDAEVQAAARAAFAHEFIQALPQGYDTFLGERGVRLSGVLAVVKNRINLATINGGVNWRRNLAMICGVGFWRLIVVNAEPQIDRAP
ncbi:MAG: ATP-binding cassette domain-containing protein, partial [Rhodoferax sp.]|nr:ATP-binding cassette domain-containing protein [Rhodoferax sp.]